MAMEGWIKLHRQLCNHELWLSEPFTRGQAWVDLLLLANHKDGFIRVRGQRIEVKRGQVGWSQKRLAERWKWSRKKVSNFLNELEKMEHQIEQQKNRVTSIITIVNFDKYQETEQQNEQQKNNRRTTEEQQKNTNKNDKNEKNEKNVSKSVSNIFTPPTLQQVIDYCNERNKGVDPERWFNFYQAKGWMVGKNKMKDWKAAVRTWENNGGNHGRTSGNPQPNNREGQSELDGIDFGKFEYKG
jgi:hypothetical protein